jgi:hypothetical protein
MPYTARFAHSAFSKLFSPVHACDLPTAMDDRFDIDMQTGADDRFDVDMQTGADDRFDVDMQTEPPTATAAQIDRERTETVDFETAPLDAPPTRPGGRPGLLPPDERDSVAAAMASAERQVHAHQRERGRVVDRETVRVQRGPFSTDDDLQHEVEAALSQQIAAETLQYRAREEIHFQQHAAMPAGLIEREHAPEQDEMLRARKRSGRAAATDDMPTFEQYMARDRDPPDAELTNPVLAAFEQSIRDLVEALPGDTMRQLGDPTLAGPQLEEVSPGYLRDFFRAPRPNTDERACAMGPECVFLQIGVAAPDTSLSTQTDYKFVGRELLLPSQVSVPQERPPAAGWCVLCWRFANSHSAHLAWMSGLRIDNVLRHHCVRAGISNGYALDKCIPIATAEHNNGVMAYQVKFQLDDYAYTHDRQLGTVVVREVDTLMHRPSFRRAAPATR